MDEYASSLLLPQLWIQNCYVGCQIGLATRFSHTLVHNHRLVLNFCFLPWRVLEIHSLHFCQWSATPCFDGAILKERCFCKKKHGSSVNSFCRNCQACQRKRKGTYYSQDSQYMIYKTEDFLNKQQSPYFFKQFTCMSWNPQ